MTTSAIPTASQATGPAKSDLALNAGAFAATVVALWYSWRRFPAVWTNDRSHGYVIAGLCLWLIWRDRHELRRVDPHFPGSALLLLGASLLWMVGIALSAQVVHLALAPAILLAWLFVVRGKRAALHGLQIAAVFMLAVPLWEALTGTLQALTVAANTALLFVVRIPARVEGTLIHLPAGTLQVAYSCAGINYLMSGLTLGTCYAFLFTTPWRTRLKIVMAAGVVSMVSNWVRVFGLVVIGWATDMRSSLMDDHVVYGWVIFGAFMPIFFLLARRIEDRDAAKGSVTVRESAVNNGSPSRTRIALATLAALCGPLIYLLLASSQRSTPRPAQAPGVSIPVVAVNRASTDYRSGFAGEAQYASAEVEVDGRAVLVERFIYGHQEQSAEMIGSENRISADSLIAGEGVFGPLDAQLRTVREVGLRTRDRDGRLAWYWYHVADVETPSPSKAKLLEFWSFLRRRPSSEIVVVSTACSKGDCSGARRALFRATTGRSMPATDQR